MTPVSALSVNCLIRCHDIEPGTEFATDLKLGIFQIDLKECRLKNIFRQLSIAQKVFQVMVKFVLVSQDELLQIRFFLGLAECFHQFFITHGRGNGL